MRTPEAGHGEADWLEGCRKGDRTAQREAYHALFPILRGAVRRYTWSEADVQDILQEAFIRIFKSMEQFDQNRGSFMNWSTRIAINTAINEGKKRARHRVADHEVSVPIESNALQDMALEDLINTLSAMPEDQYHVLNLHLVDGFNHKEIADLLDITPDISRQRLTRARKWVRDRFELSGSDLVSKSPQQR